VAKNGATIAIFGWYGALGPLLARGMDSIYSDNERLVEWSATVARNFEAQSGAPLDGWVRRLAACPPAPSLINLPTEHYQQL